MQPFAPVDIYCERLDASLLAEPLNAISNAAFFIAAFFAFRLYRAQGRRDTALLLLIGLIVLVGIGSSLFHSFANQLTLLADIIPIMLCVLVSLWLILRRLLRLNRYEALIVLAVFLFFSWQTHYVAPPFRLNGSIGYIPCLVMLWLVTAVLKKRLHPSADVLGKAALVFACSLFFRSIDMAICPAFPLGTHLLWHALNGVVLYYVAKSLIAANNR